MRQSEISEVLRDLVGTPFVDGGRSQRTGLDCWGLVRVAFRRTGVELPDYKIGCHDTYQIDAAVELERMSNTWERHEPPNLPVPSLVAIRFNAAVVNHTGVYIGGGMFLHTREKTGAVIQRIDDPAWSHRIEGYYTPRKGA